MIKRPPKFTGTVDIDGMPEMEESNMDASHETGSEDYATHIESEMGADEFEHNYDFQNHENASDMPDMDVANFEKKPNKMMPFLVGGGFVVVFLFLAYLQFGKYIGSSHSNQVAVVPHVPQMLPQSTASTVPAPDSSTAPTNLNDLLPAASPSAPETPQVPSTPTLEAQMAAAQQPAETPVTATTQTPDTTMPASSMATALPSQGPATTMPALPKSSMDTRLDALAGQVTGLQAALTGLAQKMDANMDTNIGALQQLQNNIISLQQEIMQLNAQPKAARASSKAPRSTPSYTKTSEEPTEARHMASRHEGGWVLRSATPSEAYISRPGSTELQRVVPGENINGLGRILSIQDNGGRWIVQGSQGSVKQ